MSPGQPVEPLDAWIAENEKKLERIEIRSVLSQEARDLEEYDYQLRVVEHLRELKKNEASQEDERPLEGEAPVTENTPLLSPQTKRSL